MNESTSLLIILGILIIFLAYMTLIVWFSYSRYMSLVNKLSQFRLFGIWPFSKSIQAWAESPSYKWFTRAIILFLLLACSILFVGLSATDQVKIPFFGPLVGGLFGND